MNHQYCYSWYSWSNCNPISQIRSKNDFLTHNVVIDKQTFVVQYYIVLVLDKNCSLLKKKYRKCSYKLNN